MSKSVGIAVGGLILVALAVAGYFFWWKRRNQPAAGAAAMPLMLTRSTSSLVQSVPAPTIIGKPIGGPGLGSQVKAGVGLAATAGCQAASAAYGVGAIGGIACGPVSGAVVGLGAKAGSAVGKAASAVASKLKFW